MMAGIERIKIIDGNKDGRGYYRFKQSENMWIKANELYRDTFSSLNTPLAEGYLEEEVSIDDYKAGFDRHLGIDIHLNFANGQVATMQEKFLFTTYYTVTIEYMQDWRKNIPGDWCNLKSHFYFVGYVSDDQFNKWILLDWAKTILATNQGRIDWQERRNNKDGALSSFKYCGFNDMPEDVIIAGQF